jgi:hypothetical protein
LLLACPVGRTDPTPADIARAVEQLGSPNFRTRKKASDKLWAAGKKAEPALRKALKHSDREVVRRAREILDKFKYGLYPTTPKKVVELIGKYRSGNEESRRAAAAELAKLGSPGHAALIKLAAAEQDVQLRRELFDRLTGDVVPGLLADHLYDDVEQLLELGIQNGDEQAMRNYAAFLYLTGRLEARLPEWTRRARKLTGFQAAEVLMYLDRVKGDYAAARKAAVKTDKKALITSILIEQGDWKELAANQGPPTDSTDPLEQLSYTAAYHRLAGNTAEFDKAVAAIQQFGAKNPEYKRRVAIALLLNNRPREALDLLIKSQEHAFTFELLCTQHRYREAFELAAKARQPNLPENAEDLFELGLALARNHLLLGDKDQGVKTLAKLAEDYQNPKDCTRSLKVIETEADLSLKEQALVHAVKVIDQAEREERLSKLLGHLFPDKGRQAAAWYRFLRNQAKEEQIPATFKRLQDLMAIKLPAKEFETLARAMAKAAADQGPEDDREAWYQAVGELCVDYGRLGLAVEYLAKPQSAASLTRLGDLLSEKKIWAQAADWYEKAWLKDRTQAAPLYLRGWALSQVGRKEEAKKLMDLAHLLPLAQDSVRYKLGQALYRKGLLEPATREYDFLARTGRFHYAEISNAVRVLGLLAYARKDYPRATAYHERTILVCLGNIYFIKSSAYLTVPANVHQVRARDLLTRGKPDEAIKQVQASLDSVPGDLEVIIDIVPDLDRKGRKADADKLFQRVFDHYEKVCQAHPKSALHHNSTAWMAACCRRQLDRALDHAQKAVALAPESAGYLDTLAEVHYQRGDKATAIKLMKKCVIMAPKTDYYRKQIARFEASGPPSETPRQP